MYTEIAPDTFTRYMQSGTEIVWFPDRVTEVLESAIFSGIRSEMHCLERVEKFMVSTNENEENKSYAFVTKENGNQFYFNTTT